MNKRIISILLALFMVTSLSLSNIPSSASDAGKNAEKVCVAYIPLDSRPVNYQRVEWLAESVGIKLLMPEEYMFRNVLGSMEPNPNGLTYGDRRAQLEWLKSIEGQCDYYIISLDQILSGGLVTSRWFSNSDLSFEYEIADYIINLAKEHHVILFDTVMRLASTVDYQGYTIDDYNAFRTYGRKDRKVLTGSELTIDNIVAHYKYSPDGKLIDAGVSAEKLDQYLGARERKLRLNDYILRNVAENVEFCYVGVDDSHPGNTIQTNEIAYINSILPQDHSVIYAGTDEFGMMCISRVCYDLYGAAKVNVKYFGGGEDTAADSFDYESLKNNTDKKLSSLGCVRSDAPDALQILISTNTNDKAGAASQLLATAESNIKNKLPTVIVEPSGNTNVRSGLIDSDIPLTVLLGYSNWNTAGNALGISLSMGVARYLYLKNGTPTPESHDGFIKSMTFAYLKDISYKTYNIPIDGSSSSKYSYAKILKKINRSELITSLSPYALGSHGDARVSNFRYPWARTFEMVFDIEIKDYFSVKNYGEIPYGDFELSWDGNGVVAYKAILLAGEPDPTNDNEAAVPGTKILVNNAGNASKISINKASVAPNRWLKAAVQDADGWHMVYAFIKYDPVKGDINADGSIDAADAEKCKSHILYGTPLTDEEKGRADVNSDGRINAADFVLIKRNK